jgi:hypothetical protein
MSGSAAELYQQDFVRWTEQQSTALRDVARYSFGYGETPQGTPASRLYPRTGARGLILRSFAPILTLPRSRGRERERTEEVYPSCFLKKAATGSKEALVERFSLST